MGIRFTIENRATRLTLYSQSTSYPRPVSNRWEVDSLEKLRRSWRCRKPALWSSEVGEGHSTPATHSHPQVGHQGILLWRKTVAPEERHPHTDIAPGVPTRREAQKSVLCKKRSSAHTIPPKHVELSIWLLVPYQIWMLTRGWQVLGESSEMKDSQNKQENNLEVGRKAGKISLQKSYYILSKYI